MNLETLTSCLDAAQEAALRAAKVLDEWRLRFHVQEKGRADLVTEADLTSQRVIREYLGHLFPIYGFVGEEDKNSETRRRPCGPPRWIVDPLDGTTNYVHDCPMYCVSIGLEEDGQLVAGVIYDPNRNEMFRAAKGQGAWLGSRRLQVSNTDRLENALLATGFPPDLRGQEKQLDWWQYFSLRAQSLRRTGSTALNLAYVAAGRFDGYWAFDNKPWDVAAAAVMIREAGGLITNSTGTGYDHYTPDAVAGNGPIHAALLAALSTV
jgi:myo-inositol-1(or 4)-monophosphatase